MVSRKYFKRPEVVTAAVAVFLVGLSLLAFQFGRDWGHQREEARFGNIANLQLDGLSDFLDSGLGLLHSVRNLYAVRETVTREEFSVFTATGTAERHGSFNYLSWIPRVPLAERAGFEERARAMGMPGFRITERDAQGTVVPAVRRTESFPVYFLEPMEKNEEELGFDQASVPARLEILRGARDSNELRITHLIKLPRGDGFMSILPVYQEGRGSLTKVEDRHKGLIGFIGGVFYLDDIIQQIEINDLSLSEVNIALFDLSAPPGAQLLYARSSAFQRPEDIVSELSVSKTFEIGGRKWLAVATPTSEHVQEPLSKWLPWSILAGGLLLTGALSFSMFTGMMRIAQANALRDRDAHISGIMDNVSEGIVTIDDKGTIETVNSSVERLFGYSEGELIGENVKILMPEPDRGQHDTYIANYHRTGVGKILGIGPREVTAQRKDGTAILMELAINEMMVGGKKKFIGVLRDATERKRVEERLNLVYQRLALATELAEIGIWEWDVTSETLIWDEQMYSLYGVQEKGCGGTYETSIKGVHPEDRFRVDGEMRTAIAGTGKFDTEFRVVWPDGQIRHIEGHGQLRQAADDSSICMMGVNWDITERKAAEEKLLQSQKMEAVGQLTGGIAHDFNNLLAVILGNLELLEREIAGDARLTRRVSRATDAARRGAELTSRLLAFSRRQMLQPEVIDLNQNVLGMKDLLRRTLGESIVIETHPAAGLWPAKVDPYQLENAILNLAINARDAMPDGGKLTIETANVYLDEAYVARITDTEPGDHVMVAVTDTGAGMAADVVKRVFEPFFTTKDVGKGTGLGLSMVDGFLKQSGGHATIFSEKGIGTTVKLYFPRAQEAPQDTAPDTNGGPARLTGTETILVVEDSVAVRFTVVAMLEDLGYRVLQAANGAAALALLEEHPETNLMFTDVVMPGGMTGVELAHRAQQGNPDLKVLFTSGYPDRAFARNGHSSKQIDLLSKPYTQKDLAQKIRQVLDTQERRAGG